MFPGETSKRMLNECAGRHRVVIVGGGFGGLYTAQHLNGGDVDVILVDRRNFHLFQPLLYQVATGGLSPADIASPLRSVLSKQRNARVLQAEVVDFDPERRRVLLKEGELEYGTLVVAAGAASHYFGHEEWSEAAPGLKSVEDALVIRRKVFSAFEAAELETDEEARRALLTFVVIGGGPTGVELAGALGELALHTLRGDFRSFDPAETRVLLVEGGARILPAFPVELSTNAVESLKKLGVEVRTGVQVTDVAGETVTLRTGDRSEAFRSRTVLWAAGMKANPLAALLARGTGTETDRGGRLMVRPDLSLPGHPEIYAIGDLAHLDGSDGRPLPGTAPVAMQQGSYVARRIRAAVAGKPELGPFRLKGEVSIAVIGRNAAVAAFGRWKVRGFFAWLVWIGVHIINLVEFDNQVLVLFQWAWSYFTRRRGARLITQEPSVSPEAVEQEIEEKPRLRLSA